MIEQELALRFAPDAGTWTLLGDAAEYALGENRKKIIDTIRAHGPLSPKQLSHVTDIEHELAKKTMQRMFGDGQLVAAKGVYSLPVPLVPESLFDSSPGTEGQEGHGSKGDDDWLANLARSEEALAAQRAEDEW